MSDRARPSSDDDFHRAGSTVTAESSERYDRGI